MEINIDSQAYNHRMKSQQYCNLTKVSWIKCRTKNVHTSLSKQLKSQSNILPSFTHKKGCNKVNKLKHNGRYQDQYSLGMV